MLIIIITFLTILRFPFNSTGSSLSIRYRDIDISALFRTNSAKLILICCQTAGLTIRVKPFMRTGGLRQATVDGLGRFRMTSAARMAAIPKAGAAFS